MDFSDPGDYCMLAELLDQLMVQRGEWADVTHADLLKIEKRIWRNGFKLGFTAHAVAAGVSAGDQSVGVSRAASNADQWPTTRA